jgi:hypothetical protein
VFPHAYTVFLVLLACYAYFIPRSGPADWVASSRAALTFALVERGSVDIDAHHANTGDKAFYRGHYYIVGSVGPSAAALPAYAMFRAVAAPPPVAGQPAVGPPGAGGGEVAPMPRYYRRALACMTLLAVSVPSAALGAAVFLVAERLVRRRDVAFATALVYGLATGAFPYSKALFQHQLAAFGLFVGFALCWRAAHSGARHGLWTAGLAFGFAIVSEYTVALPIACVAAWAWQAVPDRRALARVVLGAVPPGLLSAGYNFAAFGTPMPVGYRYHVVHAGIHGRGLMGMGAPSLEALYGITLSPFRGLLFLTPVLALVPAGLYWMRRGPAAARGAAALVGAVIVTFVAYNSAYAFWSGGASVGPRYLVPMLPFAALPLAVAVERCWERAPGRLLVAALVLASGANVWAQTIGGQDYPRADVWNPLVEQAIPRLRAGDIAANYGHVVGLEGWASLLPLAAAVALLAGLHSAALRRGSAGLRAVQGPIPTS